MPSSYLSICPMPVLNLVTQSDRLDVITAVFCLNGASRSALAAHHHRVSRRAAVRISHTLHQQTVSNTRGREEHVIAGYQIALGQNSVEVETGGQQRFPFAGFLRSQLAQHRPTQRANSTGGDDAF